MIEELNKLAEELRSVDRKAYEAIKRLAGRYDKVPVATPIGLQPAYKYIMYLKLMRGLDDASFHAIKRKYINTSLDIQEECRQELDKIVGQDAINSGLSSSEIRREFEEKLKTFRIGS